MKRRIISSILSIAMIISLFTVAFVNPVGAAAEELTQYAKDRAALKDALRTLYSKGPVLSATYDITADFKSYGIIDDADKDADGVYVIEKNRKDFVATLTATPILTNYFISDAAKFLKIFGDSGKAFLDGKSVWYVTAQGKNTDNDQIIANLETAIKYASAVYYFGQNENDAAVDASFNEGRNAVVKEATGIINAIIAGLKAQVGANAAKPAQYGKDFMGVDYKGFLTAPYKYHPSLGVNPFYNIGSSADGNPFAAYYNDAYYTSLGFATTPVKWYTFDEIRANEDWNKLLVAFEFELRKIHTATGADVLYHDYLYGDRAAFNASFDALCKAIVSSSSITSDKVDTTKEIKAYLKLKKVIDIYNLYIKDLYNNIYSAPDMELLSNVLIASRFVEFIGNDYYKVLALKAADIEGLANKIVASIEAFAPRADQAIDAASIAAGVKAVKEAKALVASYPETDGNKAVRNALKDAAKVLEDMLPVTANGKVTVSVAKDILKMKDFKDVEIGNDKFSISFVPNYFAFIKYNALLESAIDAFYKNVNAFSLDVSLSGSKAALKDTLNKYRYLTGVVGGLFAEDTAKKEISANVNALSKEYAHLVFDIDFKDDTTTKTIQDYFAKLLVPANKTIGDDKVTSIYEKVIGYARAKQVLVNGVSIENVYIFVDAFSTSMNYYLNPALGGFDNGYFTDWETGKTVVKNGFDLAAESVKAALAFLTKDLTTYLQTVRYNLEQLVSLFELKNGNLPVGGTGGDIDNAKEYAIADVNTIKAGVPAPDDTALKTAQDNLKTAKENLAKAEKAYADAKAAIEAAQALVAPAVTALTALKGGLDTTATDAIAAVDAAIEAINDANGVKEKLAAALAALIAENATNSNAAVTDAKTAVATALGTAGLTNSDLITAVASDTDLLALLASARTAVTALDKAIDNDTDKVLSDDALGLAATVTTEKAEVTSKETVLTVAQGNYDQAQAAYIAAVNGDGQNYKFEGNYPKDYLKNFVKAANDVRHIIFENVENAVGDVVYNRATTGKLITAEKAFIAATKALLSELGDARLDAYLAEVQKASSVNYGDATWNYEKLAEKLVAAGVIPANYILTGTPRNYDYFAFTLRSVAGWDDVKNYYAFNIPSAKGASRFELNLFNALKAALSISTDASGYARDAAEKATALLKVGNTLKQATVIKDDEATTNAQNVSLTINSDMPLWYAQKLLADLQGIPAMLSANSVGAIAAKKAAVGGLNELLDKAAALNVYDYIVGENKDYDKVWEAFMNAYNAAVKVSYDKTVPLSEIDDAVKLLSEKMEALKDIKRPEDGEVITVDDFKAAIERAEAAIARYDLAEDLAVVSELRELVNAANKLLTYNISVLTAGELKAEIKKLDDAVEAVLEAIYVGDALKADVEAEAAGVDAEKYTEASYKKFKDAVDAALALAAKDDSKVSECKAALEAVKAAKAALVVKPVEVVSDTRKEAIATYDKAVEDYAGLVASEQYSAESLANLESAITALKAGIDGNASDAELIDLIVKLRLANASLIVAPSHTSDD